MYVKRVWQHLSNSACLDRGVKVTLSSSREQEAISLPDGSPIGTKEKPNVALQVIWQLGHFGATIERGQSQIHKKVILSRCSCYCPTIVSSDSSNDCKRTSDRSKYADDLGAYGNLVSLGKSTTIVDKAAQFVQQFPVGLEQDLRYALAGNADPTHLPRSKALPVALIAKDIEDPRCRGE